MSILELILSLVAILAAAAVFFTNAVEILGGRLNLGQGSVGSVLAAVGTALPETMIPVVAIAGALLLGRDPQSASDIGIGAILGAPFLLATLALFVVGASALGFRRRRENGTELVIHREVTARDIAFFLVFFAIASGAGIVTLPVYVKVALAVVLVGAYAYYVRLTIRSGGESEGDEPQDLILWRSGSPAPTWAVAAQAVGFVTVMAVGAHYFVTAIEHLSKEVGIPAGLIALVLAPLATELPEKFNSMIWVRDAKDTLAFGNISGAMVFQSTIPVTLGLLFTKWQLNSLNVVAVGLALASGAMLYVLLRGKMPIRAPYLLTGDVMYAAFLVGAVLTALP